MQRLTVIAITLVLGACATQAEPGSLAALKADAQQEANEHCLKTTMRAYPHVPTHDVWDACHLAILKRPQLRQRVKN